MSESASKHPLPVAHLPGERVSQLLHLGLSESGRPIEELVERLSGADGADWLHTVLHDETFGQSGSMSAALSEGKATLDELRAIKEHCKKLVADRAATHGDAKLRAAVGYFFSLAAALAHHDQSITERSHRDLLPVLRDLAAVTPEPWPSLFRRAVAAVPANPSK